MQERKDRFSSEEVARGWHRQYDHIAQSGHVFLRNPASLRAFDLERVRLETMMAARENASSDDRRVPEPGVPDHAAASSSYRGFLDRVDPTAIAGWVVRTHEAGERLTVEVWDGGRLLATAKADRPREGLRVQGIDDGLGGFALPTPQGLLDGRPHWIWATVSGTDFALRLAPLVLRSSAQSTTARGRQAGAAAVG